MCCARGRLGFGNYASEYLINAPDGVANGLGRFWIVRLRDTLYSLQCVANPIVHLRDDL